LPVPLTIPSPIVLTEDTPNFSFILLRRTGEIAFYEESGAIAERYQSAMPRVGGDEELFGIFEHLIQHFAEIAVNHGCLLN
jgi:hypothetical protein